jgi:hypothetical protein
VLNVLEARGQDVAGAVGRVTSRGCLAASRFQAGVGVLARQGEDRLRRAQPVQRLAVQEFGDDRGGRGPGLLGPVAAPLRGARGNAIFSGG